MRLSLFTTATRPFQRGDTFQVAFNCYKDLADEVVIVDGNAESEGLETSNQDVLKHMTVPQHSNSYKWVRHSWPKEFEWKFIGEQFQRGYEACTGDWCIRMDLDMLFHERDYERIREVLENSDAPTIAFFKFQFIQPDRYYVKSRIAIAVNKRLFGDRIRFDGGGDLCQVTVDGEYIKPGEVKQAEIPIWNYECLLKTKEQLLEDKGRMARAWHRTFGNYKLGGPDDQSAYDEWFKMVTGRYNKAVDKVKLTDHPKVIQDTIRELHPDQWGYNGFGLFKGGYHAS